MSDKFPNNDPTEDDDRIFLIIFASLFGLWGTSALTIFVFYADWWARAFGNDPLVEAQWLDTFSNWPYIKLPLLWSILTVSSAYATRRTSEPGRVHAMIFILVLYLTYPGLEQLEIYSDSRGLYFMIVLWIIHASAAILLGDRLAGCQTSRAA